jgi:transposase
MRLAMKTDISRLDFSGQHIFVGLDISRNSWKTSILTEHFEHKTFSQPPEVGILLNYLRRNFPGAEYHCVYEAGYFGYWIHDELKEHGVDCLVVNPADVPSKHKEHQTKTDRVDARKLARSLKNGELDPIYVPMRPALEDRSLVRTRYYFVKKQTRCKNQIKAFLRFYGIDTPEDLVETHWSRRYICWLEQLSMQRATGDLALKALIEELLSLRGIIAQLTRQIRALALEEPYRKKVPLLTTIPGISRLTAMILLTELVDIQRFKTLDQLASYAGLIPGERSSGDVQIITGISSRRNPFLRTLLLECSWVAARKDPALMLTFNALARRMPKNRAIVRIARKLLNRIRYVLKNELPYQNCVVE